MQQEGREMKMSAKQQYEELKSRRDAILDEMTIVRGDYANRKGWDIAAEIIWNQGAKIDAFGDRAYSLTEKQIALIERVFAEQEERNKIFRASYDREQQRIRENEDRKAAEAAARTPEQIKEDIITNLLRPEIADTSTIDERRETAVWHELVDGETVPMGDIPAPTVNETMRILNAVYPREKLHDVLPRINNAYSRLHECYYAIVDVFSSIRDPKAGTSRAYQELRNLQAGTQSWPGIYKLVGGR